MQSPMEIPDLVEILAHLDYLVQLRKTRSLQDPDSRQDDARILRQLAQSLGNRYSENSIKERILAELRQGYVYPKDIFRFVLHFGSSSIEHLDPSIKRNVHMRVKCITLNKASQEPRSRRSQSVYSTSVLEPKKALPKSALSSQGNRRIKVLAQKQNRTHRATHKKRRSQENDHRTNVRNYSTPSVAAIPSIENETSRQDSLGSQTLTNGSLNAIQIPENQKEITKEGSYEATKDHRGPSIPLDIYLDVVAEVAFYKRRCKIAERESVNLKEKARQKASLFQRKDVSEDLSKTLCEKMRQIRSLRKKLDDQQDWRQYLPIQRMGSELNSNVDQLVSLHKEMMEQIASDFYVKESDRNGIGSFYGQSIDLDALLRSIFSTKTYGTAEERLTSVPELTFNALIQALTGAAIHIWVFEADFYSYCMENTQLLEKYREFITAFCGHERLYNLDTAIHQSLVQGDDFKNFTIPLAATRHTNRFLEATKCLFREDIKHKSTKRLRGHLNHVFKTAIQIRTLSLVGTHSYESIWPLAGNAFNKDEMVPHNPGYVPGADSIKVPLVPGIRIYSKDKELVQYKGFEESALTPRHLEKVVKGLVYM